jgi:hypothetical protein
MYKFYIVKYLYPFFFTFIEEYKEIVGENIPYLKMGFPSFEKFILSMPDVARIDRFVQYFYS